MSDNINNIPRSLEEDLLQDYINKPIPKYIEGVDSSLDVDLANNKLSTLEQKIQALAALIYLKESSVLTTKRSDAIPGSIYFDQEKKVISYYNGYSWVDNIFGQSSIVDSKTLTLKDLGYTTDHRGFTYTTVPYLTLNTTMGVGQVIMVLVDGDILDPSLYYINETNSKQLTFYTPVTVYNNIAYYVLGAEDSYSGSIPRFEVVEYIGDGVRTIYSISNNKDFVVSYKSSIMVYVNGIALRDSQFRVNDSKNQIILYNAPEIGAYIEIKTIYGVVTDFRGALTYVEQIVEAEMDKQKVFQYNGVSDAVKVYWNGKRLISGKDFTFNYVQKSVVLESTISEEVKKGDTVIIEKELVPMSKEPMQGVLVTESKVLTNNKIQLQYKPNGISNVIAIENNNDNATSTILLQKEYYTSEDTNNNYFLNIDNNKYNNWNIQVSYLTNATVANIDVPVINDDNVGYNTIWSSSKIDKELNKKANENGSKAADFNARELNITLNATIAGDVTSKSNVKSKNVIAEDYFRVGPSGDNSKLETINESDTFRVNQNVQIKKDLRIEGNLTLIGKQTGQTLKEVNVDNNSFTLNANLKTNQDPVPESGIIINRGNKGNAKLLYNEDETKWKVYGTELDAKGLAVSLEGHTHSSADLEGTDLPLYKSLTSSTHTTDRFYTDDEYKTTLQPLLDVNNNVKALDRLVINKSSIVDTEDKTAEINSANTIMLEKYTAIKNKDSDEITYKKSNIFGIIEDGSIISNSEGAILLPRGKSNKRIEFDGTYCGIDGNTFKTSMPELSDNNAWRDLNGFLRYNTEKKALEVKIDGTWVLFPKPDAHQNKVIENTFNRGRYITEFSASDFTTLQADEVDANLGFQVGEKVFKVAHNLNCLYVRIDIFDDKRAAFPLLYKCIDANNAYITFPSNINDLSNSNDILDWLKFLAAPLHRNTATEGPGHNREADTLKELDFNKKYIAIVTAL